MSLKSKYDLEGPSGARRDFYVPHDPVYAPGFGPDDPQPKSMTRDEFQEDCDINVLMSKYDNLWPPKPPAEEMYLDVSEVPDLMSAMAYLEKAETAFMTLPAKVRREFDNDPVQFVDFASHPDNIGQMREWGLAPPVELPDAVPGLLVDPSGAVGGRGDRGAEPPAPVPAPSSPSR